VLSVKVLGPCPALLSLALAALPAAARADVEACIHAADAGQKLRDNGSYRQAREQFIACAAEECPGEVRKGCVGWLAEVQKLTPTVVFAARSHGKEVTDVRVSVDGVPVAGRIDGKPVALDPGEHRFRFERAGEPAAEETAVVVAGERERRISMRLTPDPLQSTSPTGALPPQPTGAPEPATRMRGPPSPSEYALVIFGLASLATGFGLDLSGYIFWQQCEGDRTCTGAHERAEVQWRFATGDILLAVGALSTVTAWLLWQRDSYVVPQRPGTRVAAAKSQSCLSNTQIVRDVLAW
jgi:hypothetical protein